MVKPVRTPKRLSHPGRDRNFESDDDATAHVPTHVRDGHEMVTTWGAVLVKVLIVVFLLACCIVPEEESRNSLDYQEGSRDQVLAC